MPGRSSFWWGQWASLLSLPQGAESRKHSVHFGLGTGCDSSCKEGGLNAPPRTLGIRRTMIQVGEPELERQRDVAAYDRPP